MKNPLREHVRLSVIEAKRIVMRKQILVAVAVVFLVLYDGLFYHAPHGYPPALFGVVATTDASAGIAGPFIAAFAGAGALAVDTETGFLGLALSRNIRRWQHILHKVVAMWIAITGFTVLRLLLFYVVGAFFFTWDMPRLGECLHNGLSHQGLYGCLIAEPTTMLNALGPFPELFMAHPVLNDLIGVGMVGVGTTALALLGLFAAACGANGFVAMSMPVLATFPLRIFLHDLIPYWADPTLLIDVFSKGYRRDADLIWVWLAVSLTWIVLLTGLSMLIAEKRELAMKGDAT